MMEVAQKIEQFLRQRDNHYVSVRQGGRRLSKTTLPKYSFSLDDILTIYGSVEDFIKSIPENGFLSDVKINLRSINGTGASATSIIKETFTLNFSKKEQTPMQEPTNAPIAPASASVVPTAAHYQQPFIGLGYAQVPQMELTRYEVIKERFEDKKKECDQLEEQVKDLKSEVRNLKDENFSLRLKFDTAEEKHSISLERERLKQKSILDTHAVKSFADIGGRLAGVFFGKQMGMSDETMAALAGASSSNSTNTSEISQIKQDLIAYICSDDVTDEVATRIFNEIYTQ